MSDRICVYGLGHLGFITAMCLATRGFDVIGLDQKRLSVNYDAIPDEPGLTELFTRAISSKNFTFCRTPHGALERAKILWVTFDTPLDEHGNGNYAFINDQLEFIRPYVREDVLILISSQVPVGFTANLEREWRADIPGLHFAYSPENLRKGQSIEGFLHAQRIVVGLGDGTPIEPLQAIFQMFTNRILWMSLNSAEMSKHALNSFLAMSALYANELDHLSRQLGVNYEDVVTALRSDTRIGPKAYLEYGPISGKSLMREAQLLKTLSDWHHLKTPLISAISESYPIYADG